MTTQFPLARIGAVAALAGPVLLIAATLAHPMTAAPADLPAAFAEYAQDPYWVASHLGQFFGLTLVGAGLIALAWMMEPGWPTAWARLGSWLTAVSVALAGVLQAVDGVALQVMARRWMAATGEAIGRASCRERVSSPV